MAKAFTCPSCGKETSLNKDGKIRRHNYHKPGHHKRPAIPCKLAGRHISDVVAAMTKTITK